MEIAELIIDSLILINIIKLMKNNRVLSKRVRELSKENKSLKMFYKHTDNKYFTSRNIDLKNDILVYDYEEETLQMVVFNKNVDKFPFLLKLKEIDKEESEKLYKSMKNSFENGAETYYLSDKKQVHIRRDLNVGQQNVVLDMLQYRGKTSNIISEIQDSENDKTSYLLEIDHGEYIWENSMIIE